jgi:hypothetical protein
MEVNIQQAIKMFFSNSSFEMIYSEAFANALDADATQFSIDINVGTMKDLCNLTIKLSDNGVGFNDKRFNKFSKLFDVEESSHKGIGRLVFLSYFSAVDIESYFDGNKHRSFTFNETFDKKSEVNDVDDRESGSVLILKGFNGVRLKRNDNIKPSYIKRYLMENFYMRFYNAKQNGRDIKVSIKSTIGGKEDTEEITSSDLPTFSVFPVETKTDLFDNIEVYYHISQREVHSTDSPLFITALSIDERCMPLEIVAKENVNSRYNMIFLLKSESLQGASDESRQRIRMEEQHEKALINIFRKAIYQIVKQQLPEIAKANEKQFNAISEKFPHLSGLVEEDSVGYLSSNDVIKRAQDKYFRAERELLGATALTEEEFERSVEYSGRALATYIIYRQKIIERMRSLTKDNLEQDFHNLISFRRKTYSSENLEQDLYLNNIWILDDKFMTYEHTLSEIKMNEVLKILNPEDNTADNDRPDISIFFSEDPTDENKMFDVVIVELKRKGIKAEQNSIVEFQLDTRTQALAKYYGKRIQRAWFYGVVDMDDSYRIHLRNEQYKPLYSHGYIYFRSKPIYPSLDSEITVIQNSYIMDYKALIEDADSRNNTFLRILREKFGHKSITDIVEES